MAEPDNDMADDAMWLQAEGATLLGYPVQMVKPKEPAIPNGGIVFIDAMIRVFEWKPEDEKIASRNYDDPHTN